jgi:hypothetical protein
MSIFGGLLPSRLMVQKLTPLTHLPCFFARAFCRGLDDLNYFFHQMLVSVDYKKIGDRVYAASSYLSASEYRH